MALLSDVSSDPPKGNLCLVAAFVLTGLPPTPDYPAASWRAGLSFQSWSASCLSGWAPCERMNELQIHMWLLGQHLPSHNSLRSPSSPLPSQAVHLQPLPNPCLSPWLAGQVISIPYPLLALLLFFFFFTLPPGSPHSIRSDLPLLRTLWCTPDETQAPHRGLQGPSCPGPSLSVCRLPRSKPQP